MNSILNNPQFHGDVSKIQDMLHFTLCAAIPLLLLGAGISIVMYYSYKLIKKNK